MLEFILITYVILSISILLNITLLAIIYALCVDREINKLNK